MSLYRPSHNFQRLFIDAYAAMSLHRPSHNFQRLPIGAQQCLFIGQVITSSDYPSAHRGPNQVIELQLCITLLMIWVVNLEQNIKGWSYLSSVDYRPPSQPLWCKQKQAWLVITQCRYLACLWEAELQLTKREHKIVSENFSANKTRGHRINEWRDVVYVGCFIAPFEQKMHDGLSNIIYNAISFIIIIITIIAFTIIIIISNARWSGKNKTFAIQPKPPQSPLNMPVSNKALRE